MSARRIFFLTGARSEYDLMSPVIRAVASTPGLSADVIPVAAHLSPFHGSTIDFIRADGNNIVGTVESLMSSESWEGRSLSFANLVEGLTRLLAVNKPDVLFIAGDREEALAGAIVANFIGVHVAHLHGGDRCIASELDEVLRPAISKLSHLHFVATDSHRERLIRMGECQEFVWTTGAPGLDRLKTEASAEDNCASLEHEFGIDINKPFFMLIQHPSPMFNGTNHQEEMDEVLSGVLALGHPVFCSYPNTDPGNFGIRQAIDKVKRSNKNLIVYHNLSREHFVALYRKCSAIVGNSSSIVIESPFLKVPGILVGPRQDLRDVSTNVLKVGIDRDEISMACKKALNDSSFHMIIKQCESIYGDGNSSPRISAILKEVTLDSSMLQKMLPY